MLHNVYAALAGAHGFSTTAKTNPDGTQGNVVLHGYRQTRTATVAPTSACCGRPLLVGDLASIR
ncbi:hypothetical protein K443DRAFT_679269 [Laccaria amethystina LaAM-08-1]|uniref:Uncharacterized protein n=1 Tax=Laccaria amethystina LaAM-08-1 TaxID=1095629 RepID=A0A0C9WQ34_9AGAR|nr:hypothetical protein K443DRAFT_679269 [Laccaria amethystina LaAM-08-1]